LFFLLIALGIAIPASEFFTFDNLSNTISEVPIDQIMNNENGEPKIYTYLAKIGLTKERIYTFLDKLGFKKILGENLGSKILNKINNFKIKLPDENQVTDFIYHNLDFLRKIFFFDISRESVYKVVHKNYEFIRGLIDSISEKLDFSGFEGLKTISTLIRKGAVYIIEIAIAVCVIIIIVSRASTYKWLMWIHAVTLLVGGMFTILGTLGNKLIYAIIEKLKFLFLVEPFATYFTKSMVRYGIILLVISLSALILHTIIKFVVKKRKKSKEEKKETDKKKELEAV
jgi:large-conductance mechanosensitive channel